MFENLIFLVAGSAIGILTSIITIRYQHKMELQRQNEKWDHEERIKMIEDARELMKSKDYQILRYGEPTEITFCRFLVESGVDRGITISINKNVFVIGHSKELCDHTLSDTKVADVHLRLLIADDVCVLEDISGGLETYIGDRLITGPSIVNNRDIVRLGSTRLRFSMP